MVSWEALMPWLGEGFGSEVLRAIVAIVVLFVGWLAARIVAWGVKKALQNTSYDNKLAAWVLGDDKGSSFEVETWVSKIVYYILLMFALVLFFDAAGLNVVSEPIITLLNTVFGFVPQVLGAVVLVGLAWLVATVARRTVIAASERWSIDEKVAGEAGLESGKEPGLAKTLGGVVYGLVFIAFFPLVLDALQLEAGLLEPIHSMMDELLTFIPKLLAAAAILAGGWFAARIVQRVVSNLLAVVGVDQVGEKIGLGTALGTRKLSGLAGLVVYVFILFNVILASLNALSLEAITGPASEMLSQVLQVIPRLLAASVLLMIAFYVGRLVSQLLTGVLGGAGFDTVLEKLGLSKVSGDGGRRPSEIAGTLLLTALMLFASIEAAGLIGFENLSALLTRLLEFAGQLALGIVVFGVGLFLANVAADTIRSSGNAQAGVLATAARIGILVLSSAIALGQMGIADDIIQLAFGLILGSFAVAAAIAFGLGGRDVAAKQIEEWRAGLKSG